MLLSINKAANINKSGSNILQDTKITQTEYDE